MKLKLPTTKEFLQKFQKDNPQYKYKKPELSQRDQQMRAMENAYKNAKEYGGKGWGP